MGGIIFCIDQAPAENSHLQPGPSCPLRIECPGQCRALDRAQAQFAKSDDVVDRNDQVPLDGVAPWIDRSIFFSANTADGRKLDTSRESSGEVVRVNYDMPRPVSLVPDVKT